MHHLFSLFGEKLSQKLAKAVEFKALSEYALPPVNPNRRVSVWLDRLGWVVGISLLGLSATAAAFTLSYRQPQVLPVGARVVVGGQTVDLEIALTKQQQLLGLSYRRSLPAGRGMLFPVHPPRPVTVWMKHMSMPLDIVFLRQGRVVAIAHNAPPCQAMICPLYGSNVSVDYVVELPAGMAQQLKLRVGTQMVVVLGTIPLEERYQSLQRRGEQAGIASFFIGSKC